MKILLQDLGFKKVLPNKSLKNLYWWKLNIKHKFLKNLHVIVEPEYRVINVYLKDIITGGDQLIYQCKLTTKNLKSALTFFKK